MPPRRTLGWVLAAALLVPAAAGAARAHAATAADLQRARDRIERTSADLARARTAADRVGGSERAELERLERRLQAQKSALLRLESGLAARHAQQQAAAGTTTDPTAPGAAAAPAAADGGVIVLGEPAPPRPVGVAGYRTDPNLNGGGQTLQERLPAVTGDDAALAARIDAYLASKASPLTGQGAAFVAESRRVGLDPRLLVAIAGSETSFGTYGPSQAIHNPFGMGPGLSYPSWADAIAAAATNLSGALYLGDGRVTISAIQQRWAPHGATNDPSDLNVNWTRNVGFYYAEQGGDPAAPVFTAAATPATATQPAVAVPGAAQATVAAPVAYGAAAPVIGASGTGSAAAERALSVLGTRGVRSGASPETGFDGPGLVAWAYGLNGVTLPRSAAAQARVGTPVAPGDLRAGDAIFFADPSGYVHHEGLYLGDGQFVHAPGAGDVVKISSLYEPFFAEAYAGARRY